jgi:hypothetical protein
MTHTRAPGHPGLRPRLPLDHEIADRPVQARAPSVGPAGRLKGNRSAKTTRLGGHSASSTAVGLALAAIFIVVVVGLFLLQTLLVRHNYFQFLTR